MDVDGCRSRCRSERSDTQRTAAATTMRSVGPLALPRSPGTLLQRGSPSVPILLGCLGSPGIQPSPYDVGEHPSRVVDGSVCLALEPELRESPRGAEHRGNHKVSGNVREVASSGAATHPLTDLDAERVIECREFVGRQLTKVGVLDGKHENGELLMIPDPHQIVLDAAAKSGLGRRSLLEGGKSPLLIVGDSPRVKRGRDAFLAPEVVIQAAVAGARSPRGHPDAGRNNV